MRTARTTHEVTSYLDVSQYIIKEHSPLLKPISPQLHQRSEISRSEHTPEIAPIDHDPSQFILTPITSGLIRQEIEDIMEDFILDTADPNFFQSKSQGKRKKNRRHHQKESLALHMFRLDCELERIIEDDGEWSDLSQSISDSSESQEDIFEDDHCYGNSNTMFTLWAGKSKSKESTFKDIEEQKQTTIDISAVDYSESIERFNRNPKMEIIRKVREIEHLTYEMDEPEKKNLIKKYLEKYLLEHEVYCYQEAWKDLNGSLRKTIDTILEGIEETFTKKIGSLPFENRRVKLLKYLEKKKKRIWRKKVSYDCRKKVADGRLRIKGKFVTREQACDQLGLANLDNYTAEQIKQMLEKKIEESIAQGLAC